MFYVQETEYFKKLIPKLKGIQYQFIDIYTEALNLTPIHSESDCLLIEMSHDKTFEMLTSCIIKNQNRFHRLFLFYSDHIDSRDDLQVETIHKYQSYKQIQSLLLNENHEIILLTNGSQTQLKESTISEFQRIYSFDYLLSLDFEPQSKFTLFQYAEQHTLTSSNSEVVFEKRKVNAIITNINDYLNPPENDILQMIHSLQLKGSLAIIISNIKHAFDLKVLQKCHRVVIASENFQENSIFLEALKQHYHWLIYETINCME